MLIKTQSLIHQSSPCIQLARHGLDRPCMKLPSFLAAGQLVFVAQADSQNDDGQKYRVYRCIFALLWLMTCCSKLRTTLVSFELCRHCVHRILACLQCST